MNVKVYVDKIKKWVQISSDEVLDVNKNLSDLKDKEAAITNLGLYEKFISKEALESGFLPDVFTPDNIITDSTHQFVTDEEKSKWNNKLNAPVPMQDHLENNQIGYDSANSKFYIGLNNQNVLLGGSSCFDNIIVVNGFFSGNSQPTVIRNNKFNEAGQLITPVFVDVQCVEYTAGDLGEVSVSYTADAISIYNTGSFTGSFQCLIVYPLGSVNE